MLQAGAHIEIQPAKIVLVILNFQVITMSDEALLAAECKSEHTENIVFMHR